MAVRLEAVISPVPRLQFATGIGYSGFYWGLVADCLLLDGKIELTFGSYLSVSNDLTT